MHPVEMLGDDWYRHGAWGIDVVETEDDAQIARDAGVDMLQGYLIGRPHGELSEGRLPLAANA